MTDELITYWEKIHKIENIRWFNLSFKPAVEKMLANGLISKYVASKLLEPVQKLERERVPCAPRTKALKHDTAYELDDDKHLLLLRHERGIRQPQERKEGTSIFAHDKLRFDGENSVSTPVQTPERRNSTFEPLTRICSHIWTCACKT